MIRGGKTISAMVSHHSIAGAMIVSRRTVSVLHAPAVWHAPHLFVLLVWPILRADRYSRKLRKAELSRHGCGGRGRARVTANFSRIEGN
jgi:hypothetical protein